jgi:predicted nucleic acid-binding protein
VILVDSSVWVDHLRRRHAGLAGLLDQGLVVIHPFIVGEIALGLLKNRAEILDLLTELPSAPMVRHEDALAVVERRGLAGAGIGWVDAHLLASALVGGIPLWTLDRRLETVARAIGASWER